MDYRSVLYDLFMNSVYCGHLIALQEEKNKIDFFLFPAPLKISKDCICVYVFFCFVFSYFLILAEKKITCFL